MSKRYIGFCHGVALQILFHRQISASNADFGFVVYWVGIRDLRVADIVIVVVASSLVVLSIAEGFIERLTAAAKNMRLLLFVRTKRASILVDDVDIPLNDDRAFRVTAYFGWARVTGIGHNCYSPVDCSRQAFSK